MALSMTDEHDFKKCVDTALSLLSRELAGAADDYGFETEFKGGVITVECGHPAAKFTIAANMQAQNVTVSLPAKSYELEWDIVENAFIHGDSGRSLKDIVEQALSKQMKQDVSL